MHAFTTIAIAATTLLGLSAAAPANQVRSTGVIHRIFAGSTVANKGLHFGMRQTQNPSFEQRTNFALQSPRMS